MKLKRWPRTDIGTVILHWLVAIDLIWLVLTGARIASDEPYLSVLLLLDPVLPERQLWLNHMIGSYVMTVASVAYVAYVVSSGLFSRVKFDGTRLSGLLNAGRARRAALNILSYWAFFALIAAAVMTGWMIFFGAGSAIIIYIHLTAFAILLVFPVVHLVLQARLGGIRQLARIVRPSSVPKPVPEPDMADLVADLLAARAEVNSRAPKPQERQRDKRGERNRD